MSTDYEPPPDDSVFAGEDEPDFSPRPGLVKVPGYNHPLEPYLYRIATALETIAQNGSRGPSAPPGGSGPPQTVQMPPAAPKGPDTTKMGKKVYAVCRAQNWEVPTVGEQITGHPMNPNSQKWSFEDLRKVLDQFTEWGV